MSAVLDLPPAYAEALADPDAFLAQVARESLLGFAQRMYPGYVRGRHHELIAEVLEAVSRKEVRKAAIFVPPRHGKSDAASVYFPAWHLGNHPDERIIACSYAASLAYRFSRRARNLLRDPAWPWPGVRPAGSAATVQSWDLEGRRGGYVAAGVGGSVTGMGCQILLIDDPVKSQAEADSEVVRESTWEWYRGTALTRLEPDGAVVLIGTRWQEDDLLGRAVGEHPAEWHVLELEAVAETMPDPLGRQPGEALWPDRWPIEELRRKERDLGSRIFTAQYQQKPSPAEGETFRRGWWKRYRALPTLTEVAICVDSAFKEGTRSDFSVFATWGTDGLGSFYLLDLVRERLAFPELVRTGHDVVRRVAALLAGNPRRIAIPLVVEDKASGQSAIQTWQRPLPTESGELLPALNVVAWPVPAGMSKIARAEAVSPVVEAGRAFLPESAPWVEGFIEEHAKFPTGAHDDQVDTTGIGLARLNRQRRGGFATV